MKKITVLIFMLIFLCTCSSQTRMSNYEKGIEAAKNKQYEQAIIFFNNAVNEEDDNEVKASSLYNSGLCCGILKKFDEEINYYEKSLETLDTFQPALYSVGMYYYEIKADLQNALKMFEKLAEVNPEHEGAFYMIGAINNDLGNKKEAIDNLKKAAELGSPEAQKMIEEN